MKVLVTGASGFVGKALCRELAAVGHEVMQASRQASGEPSGCVIARIDGRTDWGKCLLGCEAVVHLAARVHVMRDTSVDPLGEFRRINVEGTLNLARQAAASGVRRFVFISSIKVNGEGGDRPYSEPDPAAPQDDYSRSKWEAEQGLREIAKQTGMEVVILRPPLVYGPGVGANFRRLMEVVARGLPLPFGSIKNRRSLLYLGNLVDAIRVCLTHPKAANNTYLLSDGEDVSTSELIRRLAQAMDRPARLLPVPPAWFDFAGRLLGKQQEVARLLGSLAVDSEMIRRELDWQPPFTMTQGLAETVLASVGSRKQQSTERV